MVKKQNNVTKIEKIIYNLENKIGSIPHNKDEKLKESLDELRMELKRMIKLVNNSDMTDEEYDKHMFFLKIHYNYLQNQIASSISH